jgi:predicted acyltransferase
LIAAGAVGIVLGLIWNHIVPLNKILWSSSFAVFTTGWACLVLALFYWIIEVKGWSRPMFPFVVFGMNAIALYVATGLFVRWIMLSWRVPYRGAMTSLTGFLYKSFSAMVGATAGSLLYSFFIIAAGWLLCYWMFKKKIFLKV